MKILAFDTSSRTQAVALLDKQELLADVTVNVKKNHSISLMPSVDFLLRTADLEPQHLDRIAVAQGPGSYTGLRVAAATAKTLAYTLKIGLVGVSSLYALAAGLDFQGLVIPLMDARRNHVYVGYYKKGRPVRPDCYAALTDVFEAAAQEENVLFVGEAERFQEQIAEALPQARILPTRPSAYEIGKLGSTLDPVDTGTFVPTYLKRVEAEEKWLKDHQKEAQLQESYIKRI
ncbi:tRNA (adenosine(37)-N6)-threonylcarbamoyltransferase complex dimerization subunit type 1 TsaB [Streptococcus chenjunshii]|uniref:tRNA (Adenosine(37)-N6)-threonylcarbamoyltransferase complex dimerization subunit type 1 TsaB n=1 Tax=Streptococcus chenjunshii TaxID=2173853 RepID=A0A372KNP6_9STRE|nr:tRNA (adenosine(37)-N6)-threonylcarbamoyltransferase complex dimerization subunit type 1 TsaB [Streptococcus chenjunshii]AXQ77915.1 tRNA (adenosine(37)-N6)-threonylcarbamoyltransferase complex dimerization subunit type 1 TsaB [Streptococcus chenjunshii]RFU51842.1 tRNA (adenosine(37)-N6)-threonylcarbamoyltransferase complex dimerization subunit type 1 TsaB [Streptococcus chenjunshii]RFU53930.1 tRNA (adenosine(37)-N6)-threonylcarbamoyltransferase complex dimerization subunit type 1 TsaB [Strept